MPIIAVILMLVSRRARANGPAFLVGWIAGLALIGVIVLLIVQPTHAGDESGPATWISVLELVAGVLLLVVALRQWRSRPLGDDEPVTPKWMGAIDAFSPGKALGAGAVLAAANPKNLLLSIAAAAEIEAVGLSGGQEAVAYAVFALIATIGVAAPVAIFFAMGDRAGLMLAGLQTWMARNNAVIMAVLLLVIGAKLIGDAISGFST